MLVWSFGLMALWTLALVLRNSTAFEAGGFAMSLGLAIDLTVTASLMTWAMVVRTGDLSRLVLVPVFVLGVVIATALVPAEHESVVLGLAYAWAAVEALLALMAIGRMRRLTRSYRDQRALGMPVSDSLERALATHVPSATFAALAASELAILWYGIAGWTRREPAAGLADRNLKQWTAVVGVLAVLVTAESVGLHVLLRGWSEAAAWTVTALHVYSLLWLFGDRNALRHETTAVEAGVLRIRLGLRASVDVPVDCIERIDVLGPSDESPPPSDDYLPVHLLFGPNAVIHLRQPVEARLLFGRRRQVTRIGLAVEDPAALPMAAGG